MVMGFHFITKIFLVLCLLSRSVSAGQRAPLFFNDKCDGAVARAGTTNSMCRKLCATVAGNPLMADAFHLECTLEEFSIDPDTQKVYFGSHCFDQWMHGHSEEEFVHGGDIEIGTLLKHVPSAYRCQELCQVDEKCVRFSWNFQQNDHACVLKTKEDVNRALDVVLTRSGSIDHRWCPANLAKRCAAGAVCAQCPSFTCVYISEEHIAGPKFCKEKPDHCAKVE